MSWERRFQHRHKTFVIACTESGALELRVDGCVRKRRSPGRTPQYVWTNLEMEWEAHHYVEARYWRNAPRLQVTVNGEPIFDGDPTSLDRDPTPP